MQEESNAMHTEHSRLIRGLVSVGASTFLRLFLGFISLIIAARSLTPDEFGVYFLIVALAYLLEVIGDFGQRLTISRFVAGASSDSERRTIVNTMLVFRLITIGLVAPLSMLAKPLLLFLFPSDLLSDLFIYVPILFCVQILEGTFANIMQGYHQYRKTALVRAITGGLNFGLVVILLLVFPLGAQGLILANVLSIGMAALIRFQMVPGPKRLAFDPHIMRRLIRFGSQLQLNDVMTFIFDRIDVLILGALLGPGQIAFLEVAARIPNYFQQLFHAVNAVYLPHMSELFGHQKNDEAEVVLNTFLRLAAFLMLGCTLVLILFGREVVTVVFDITYLPSVPVMGILMVVITISLLSQILDIALISAGRPVYLLIANAVMMVASLIADVTLIPAFGLMGVAVARLAANLTASPVSFMFVRRMNIQANVMAFARPFMIFGSCLLLYFVFSLDTFFARSSILGLYLILSILFSAITLDEVFYIPRRIKLPEKALAVEL